MTFRTSTRTKIVAVTALVILLVAQQTLEIPGYGRLARGTQDAMHGPWFAMVTALVWILLFRPISISLGRGTAMFLLVVSVVCLAIATECLQVLTGREGSLRDVMLDMGGAGGHGGSNKLEATPPKRQYDSSDDPLTCRDHMFTVVNLSHVGRRDNKRVSRLDSAATDRV